MPNLISDYLGVHAQAMPLREQRMKLIASNLSMPTPPGTRPRTSTSMPPCAMPRAWTATAS